MTNSITISCFLKTKPKSIKKKKKLEEPMRQIPANNKLGFSSAFSGLQSLFVTVSQLQLVYRQVMGQILLNHFYHLTGMVFLPVSTVYKTFCS